MTTTAHPLDAVVEDLNDAQRDAVLATDGPVLLIAGPGAGKTLTLVRRTLHILTSGLADPGQIVLCTFTEKAALELRDRLRVAAIATGYQGDLSSLRTGTIHGVCNEFVDRYRHLTPLGNGYEVLDELTQALFLFEHFGDVFGEVDDTDRYLGRWATKWTAISGIQRYLDKITEELIDPALLVTSGDTFVQQLGRAHAATRRRSSTRTASTSLISRSSSSTFSTTRRLVRTSARRSATSWSTSTKTRTTSRNDCSIG